MPDGVKVTNPAGYDFGDLDDVTVKSVTWELNGPGSLELSVPAATPSASLLVPGREVQYHHDGEVIWCGPLVRRQASMTTVEWQCRGLLWYFSRRYMGKADRVNHILNGGFEDGEANWAFTSVTHSIDTSIKIEGEQSLRLTGTGADQYAEQVYTHTAQYHPDGDFLTLAGWAYIDSSGYTPAGGAAALYLEHRNSNGDILETQAEVVEDTDRWVRVETGTGGAHEGDTVVVRLYAPDGTAHWDLVTLTLMESLVLDDDIADVAGDIVRYAQDQLSFTHGKSNLRVGTYTPTAGAHVTRVYQFAEHRNILDAIGELVGQGHFDIDIVPATRTFTTYTPRKGADRGDITLELGVNVADWDASWDGEAAATSVVVTGAGDGPDREEGVATDSAFLDGLTLESMESASDGATPGELDNQAAELLAAAHRPEVLEVTTTPGAGLLGDLQVGDRAPVAITWGTITIGGTWRVVTMTWDPLADTLRLELNPEINVGASSRAPNAVDACTAGTGTWVAALDGGVFSYGGATSYGSMGGVPLNAPVCAIAPTPSGAGYWLAGADGGVFTFGDAAFYGSMVGTPLNAPVVSITPTPSGDGYWLLAADGGIFAFGDATSLTATLDDPAPSPVDAVLAPTGGLWAAASDGGVFSYGAAFHGSLGASPVPAPVVAIVAHGGGGYWLVGADGRIYEFGDAPTRHPDGTLRDIDYPLLLRAVIAAEPLDPGGDDNLLLICDDGTTVPGGLTP